MTGHIIGKELRETVHSSRFAYTYGVCSLLILLAFVIGARNHQAQLQRHRAAVAENLRQMEGLTDWLRVNSHRIFLPPRPLESLVTGISNDIGRTVEMSGRGELAAVNSRYNDDPLLAMFRFLDLEFIFQVVLSLFAVLFAYDAINGEKERGTLRLTFANPVPRHKYILGKLLGSLSALVVPLAIPVLLGCLLLPALGMVLSTEEWVRLALVLLAGILYVGVFLTLSVLVSTLTHRSSSSFLFMLVIWTLSVLIVPRASVLLAGRSVAVLSVDEIAHLKGRLRSQLWREDMQKLEDFSPEQTEDPEKLMQEFNAYMDEIAAERDRKMSELSNRLNEQRANGQRRQELLAYSLARVSPTAAFTLAATRLVGTSIDLKQHFAREAAAYQDSYGKFMQEKTGMNLGGRVVIMKLSSSQDGEQEKPIDPHELPAFHYRPPGLAESFDAALPDLGLLAGFNVLFFLAAFVAFLRYDLR
jgi:ABC-type transport system involved in multi-copper enzyme maturation permease subunit